MNSYAPMIKETLTFFAYTVVELTVLFVGISFLVGVINEFLPQDKVKQWLSGRKGSGYLIGSILGGLTPFCSCSTIPVTIGLLRAGAGFGPTMAFLFTSPLVNPIIIPLFLTLLGPKVTVIYALVAIVMTIGISFLLERGGFLKFVMLEGLQERRDAVPDSSAGIGLEAAAACCAGGLPPFNIVRLPPVQCCAPAPGVGGAEGNAAFSIPMYTEQPSRWRSILHDAVRQFRNLLPYVILGVAIGSVIHGFLPADLVVRLAGADNPLAVPVSALVGIPLYLRVSTMVPIAASLIGKGMSIGAVVALIIGGAGASLPEVAMLKGMFRWQLLAAFLASVMVMAVSAGFLVNIIVL